MMIIQNFHVRNVFTKNHFKISIFQEKKGPPRVPRNSIEGPRGKEIHCFWTSKMRCSGHKTFSKVSEGKRNSVQNFYKTQKRIFPKKSLFFGPLKSIEIALEEPGDPSGTLC